MEKATSKRGAMKRKATDPSLGGSSGREQRHKAWISRYHGGARVGSWRPVQLNRCGAKRWLVNVDGQLRLQVATSPSGWKYFQYDASLPCWSHWSRWPWCGVAMDLGSDGLAASSALLHLYDCNITRFDDFSHGANNDLKVTLKACGLFSFWLVCMISWNLPYGHDQDEQRRRQLRECMAHVYEAETFESCVLFKEWSAQMLSDWINNGNELPGVKAAEEELWDALVARTPFARCGRRASLCRFQDLVAAGEANVKFWAIDAFERTTVALELDFLKGRGFNERIRLKMGATEEIAEGGCSTSTKLVTAEMRSLRSCAANAVVISVSLLSDTQNRRVVNSFLSAASVIKEWHGHQNKVLRSGLAAREWLVQQVAGLGYMRHVSLVVGRLGNVGCLAESGFVVSVGEAEHASMQDAINEDFYADVYGQVMMNMASARMRRGLWLTSGWPLRMTAALGGVASAERTVALFRRDVEAWEDFQEYVARTGRGKKWLERHCFRQRANLQYVEALRDLRWVPAPAFLDLVAKRSTGVISSQASEDMIGAAKNDVLTKTTRHFRKPETALAKILEHRVLDQRHKYRCLSVDTPQHAKSERLASTSFRASLQTASMDFGKIVTSGQPTWYSPSATNCNTPHADLALLRSAAAERSFAALDDAWLGEFFSAAHRFAFCQSLRQAGEASHADDTWFIALWQWPHSAVLAWECVLKKVPGTDVEYLELSLAQTEPALVSIFTLKNVFAATITWRSWLWQYLSFESWRPTLDVAVRPFLGEQKPLIELAAECAFWNMSRTQLVHIAGYLGRDLSDPTSLFAVLHDLVKGLLGRNDAETMRILSLRLCDTEQCNEWTQELLEIDAAADLLEKSDQEALHSEQDAAVAQMEVRSAFRDAFARRRREDAEKAKAAAPKAKKKKVEAAKARMPTELEQQEAKRWLPPHASIWRGRIKGYWFGHLPPFPRISAAWKEHSEVGAMRLIIRRLWDQHLMVTGASREDCPFLGIWD